MRVRGDVTMENSKREIGRCYAVALKLQEGHEPRDAGDLSKVQKQGNILP